MDRNTREAAIAAQLATIRARIDSLVSSLQEDITALKIQNSMLDYRPATKLPPPGLPTPPPPPPKLPTPAPSPPKQPSSITETTDTAPTTTETTPFDYINSHLNTQKNILVTTLAKESLPSVFTPKIKGTVKLIEASEETVEQVQQETTELVTNLEEMAEIRLHTILNEAEDKTCSEEEEHGNHGDELAVISLQAIADDLSFIRGKSSRIIAKSSSKVPATLMVFPVIKSWEIDVLRHSILAHVGVHEAGQPTIEWLIAWRVNSLPFDLRTSRFTGRDVLIRLQHCSSGSGQTQPCWKN